MTRLLLLTGKQDLLFCWVFYSFFLIRSHKNAIVAKDRESLVAFE